MTSTRLASFASAPRLVTVAAAAALPAVLAVPSAHAQPSATPPPPPIAAVVAAPAPAPEPANSINVSPLGLLFGSYAIGYERLLPGGHGILVEAAYARSSGDDVSSETVGGALGYRWHWRGRQDSGFLGVTLDAYRGTASATVGEGADAETFSLDASRIALTANVGKRWQWDSGLNVTLRIGAGYGRYGVSTASDDPDAQEAVAKVDDLLRLIPVALDGELSLGYSF